MMTDDAFARLVSLEVKNQASPDQIKLLRESENLKRWARALEALEGALDDQVQDLKARQESEERRYRGNAEEVALVAEIQYTFGEKIRKTARFKQFVQKKQQDVQRYINAQTMPVADGYEHIIEAIRKHKELTMAAGLEPTPIDEALWAAWEHGDWLFDTIDPNNLYDDGDTF